ncbi:Transcriptional regulator, TetR family [Paraburkholderia piptadeniae]|uniref:Transcriptional regulator, TetR family n=1 Tax=Paraburkholderia piptadeniae TaxID=1701573 RepID=A0A1N7S9B7_9BURK|nr:TetR/AcrR family transcriptional regulator [Paraburkholderia piptadeniae]SIT43921.1 Transcriptional regulator, TetR family [Paraburkholderia piptadeniae]
MARPLEFDRNHALSCAVDAFWRDGYASLSANDLAADMGVAKSSMYNTFGSKRDLLVEAVTCYASSRTAAVRATLRGGNTRAKLRAMLLDIVNDNDGGRGCLLVNTAAELGLHDEGVRQLVKAGFEGMMGSFEEVIRLGQARGDIDLEVDAAKQAVTLVAGIAGLRVMAKSGFTKKQLAPFVETLLAGLTP